MRRTIWPAIVIFLVVGMVLSWGWSPSVVSSAAPPAERAAAEAAEASAAPARGAASLPQDDWQARPYAGSDYNAKKVATVSLKIPEEPNVAKEPTTDTPAASETALAVSSQALSDCRKKYLRTLHLPKAAPKAKSVGLLDQSSNDKAAKAADPNKAVAILNQRILMADDCLKRAGRG